MTNLTTRKIIAYLPILVLPLYLFTAGIFLLGGLGGLGMAAADGGGRSDPGLILYVLRIPLLLGVIVPCLLVYCCYKLEKLFPNLEGKYIVARSVAIILVLLIALNYSYAIIGGQTFLQNFIETIKFDLKLSKLNKADLVKDSAIVESNENYPIDQLKFSIDKFGDKGVYPSYDKNNNTIYIKQDMYFTVTLPKFASDGDYLFSISFEDKNGKHFGDNYRTSYYAGNVVPGSISGMPFTQLNGVITWPVDDSGSGAVTIATLSNSTFKLKFNSVEVGNDTNLLSKATISIYPNLYPHIDAYSAYFVDVGTPPIVQKEFSVAK